jgi:hypothetical protein
LKARHQFSCITKFKTCPPWARGTLCGSDVVPVSHNFQQLRFWLWQKKQTREKKRRAANNAVAVTAKSVRARVSANLLSNLDLGSFWHTMQREREREREREKKRVRERKREIERSTTSFIASVAAVKRH